MTDTKTILIVDDDDLIREFLKELLSMNNYHLIEAHNGKEGLKQVRNNNPDLVITDIVMPEMEGITFISELKTINPDLPVIAMTGNVHGRMEEYLDISSKLGANEILRKPVRSKDLLETVNKFI